MNSSLPTKHAIHAGDTGDRPPPNVTQILDLLREEYGELVWRPHGDGIAELILTILSQHTSDTNSGRAFARLLSLFPDWDAVRMAPTRDIVATISTAGLSTIKGPRIKEVLQQVKDRVGNFDLAFLCEMPLNDARAWLMSLPGVGPKTAACVLLFGLGRPAMPVDTHVFRVAKRLGLLPPKASPDAAHQILESMVSPDQVFAFHVALIKHGRRICHAPTPSCNGCILNTICPSTIVTGPGVQKLINEEGAT